MATHDELGSDVDTARVEPEALEPTVVHGPAKSSDAPRGSRHSLPARDEAALLRLHEVIGRGGMGEVYRADQVELGRAVAFKQLIDADDEELRERFLREARITAQLDHPNIVPVHVIEVPPNGRSIGYAMKLVEGKTLRMLIDETVQAYRAHRPIDVEHALATRLEHFVKVCDAMHFAHARGILHRDLKPANIMIGKYHEVYVMDWGIARPIGAKDSPGAPSSRGVLHEEPELTRVGEIIGTPQYSSPEQAAGRNSELDARADQYSLGLMLFQIVALKHAIGGDSPQESWVRASLGEKEPLEHISPRERIPGELRAIIDKATALAPGDRYVSVADLAADVRRFLRGEAIVARPDTPVQRLARFMSRHRRGTLAAFIILLALAATAISVTLYTKARGELATRGRGERKTALYIAVASQAYKIDAQFQSMEEGLEGLRVAAEWALTGPEPPESAAPIYFQSDYADPARRPRDFTGDTRYRWEVSVEHPVAGVAPGTSRDAVTPEVRRLSPLRHHMRAMFVASAGEDPAALSAEQTRALLLERRAPIDYAYISLPDGVHFMLPGMADLPPDYDVRTADFYKMSERKHGRRWGSPYVDATTDEQGDDLVLPCTQGLWSPSGEFLGVAGVEITVTKLVETGLVLPGYQTIRASLVNGNGEKVIDSGDANKRFKASGKDEGMVLSDFDIPEVVSAVRGGGEGLLEVDRGGRSELVAFARLDALGWYYVVELDTSIVDEPPE